MKTFKLLLLLFTFQPLLFSQPLNMETITSDLQQNIATKLKGKNGEIVRELYAKTGNRPLWIGAVNSEKMAQLIQALKDPLFNYKNKSFDQKNIKKLLYYLDNNTIPTSKKAAVYARLDLLLSNSYVRLVRFIVEGDVDWELVQQKFAALKESDDIQATWEMKPKKFPPHGPLIAAVKNGNIRSYLESLLPLEERYRKLVKLLKNYKRMEKFPQIPYSNTPLKLGDNNSRVLQVKKRLQISGDYPKWAKLDKKFDKTMRQAVITYQKRYLLEVTGEVDKTMTWYLNQPARKNIQAIITNLDKTKLYPKSFEKEYIEVNVPDFNLRYYKNGEMVMKKGVVVGRIDRPTPIFDDKMEYVVINPTWTIPDNLIKRDLIHVLREDPNYLVDHNIHVFRGNKEVEITQAELDPYEHSDKRVPWRFVQFPGDSNALGRVKFMFPNKYAVYLHDTDNKSLLDRRYKVYSSGCMRVEQPFELADLVLQHARGNWSREKIEKIIATDKPKTIRLKRPIPVHIVYFTVYEEDGLAYFKHDIYLYDMIIEQSTAGNRKPTFTVPKKRMISIKKQKQKQQPLSN
ncbi:MAG: L,D-transpeptidase family protein [Sulfurovum sp.]|nr:L,D-transpeptidase family protein [Sulfurovum sp.]